MEISNIGQSAALAQGGSRMRQAVRRWGFGLAVFALAAAAQAQTNPLAKGPDPTSALLNATSGPFAISSTSVSRFGVTGFGGGTVYFPTTAGTYATLAICPGFTATQSSVAWLGRRLASHGFVVMTIDTNSTFDQPPSRATQLMAALRYLTNSSSSTVRSRVDAARLGVAGHSMGGGGSLLAARDNPTLRAAVPLTAWSTTKNFSTVRVPTLVVGAENDSVASVASHSIPFYTSLAGTLDKAYAELNNASHFAPNSTNTPIGRYSVAWVKRFMDNDTRYEPFLCGAPHAAFATATVFSDYRSTCPY
jgi:pimeloyl-ACP methyl ester carboxylesterase